MVVLLASCTLPLKAITLRWDANKEPDLAGYTVYSGTNAHTYNKSNYVGNVISNTPTGLIEGLTYFFAVAAKNTSGIESLLSNEISMTIPALLGQPVKASTQLVSGKIKLSWGSTPSSTFRIYYKTNLNEPTWAPLTANLVAAGTTTTWTDPALPNAPSRFYRVFKTQ